METETNPKGTLSEMTLTFGDRRLEFKFSTSYDVWTDLLCSLLNFRVEEPNEAEEDKWELILYGAAKNGYLWRFEKINDDEVNLNITGYYDISRYMRSDEDPDDVNNKEEMFGGIIDIDALILAIIRRVDEFLKSNSVLTYSDEWSNFEFPITRYLRLKKYLLEKQLWKSELDISETFKNELEILLK